MDRGNMQVRCIASNLETRDELDDFNIEGYFVVFNRETELWPGAFESVDPSALDKTMGNDIRALINHETRLVLGRSKAGTLELKIDAHGLWGRVKINKNDSEAVNLYERVKRGDVDQCSFGFNIVSEETDFRDDGTIKWTIRELDLHEVSVVTFPAYTDTAVQARKAEFDNHHVRKMEQRKQIMKERLKHGTKTTDAGE